MTTGTMQAAVLQGAGRLAVETVPVPELGPGDVLVAVDHCGVCGTDLHLVLDGWGQPGTIPGHEWTGVVAAVGPDVEQWQAGDAVVGGPPRR
nr:alcohol dehydrogenase catalytic domain-containing protein [Acidimicrobiia bacterium]